MVIVGKQDVEGDVQPELHPREQEGFFHGPNILK